MGAFGKMAGALARGIALAAALSTVAAAQSRSPTLIRDAEIERTLRMMTDPIFKAAGLAPESVKIFILLDPSLNAFVANGRNMFLHTGLLQQLDKPETLIGVMAHETGHITGGHLARRAIAADNASGPAVLGLILAIAAGVASGSAGAGAAAALGGQSAINRTMLAFSRGEESAADQAGISFMNRAGVDPEGILDLLRVFKGQEVFSSSRLDPWALTHPLSSERISSLESRIADSPARGAKLPPEKIYWFERMRAKLDGFTDDPARTLARLEFEEHPDSELNLYRRAIAEFRLPDADAALRTLDKLQAMRPDDPFYHELRGQILFESARAAEAVAPYRKALALAPDEPLIAGNLGRALLASGKPGAEAEALEILRNATRKDAGDPAVLRDLAIAYARAGDEGMATLTTAERLALTGNLSDAGRQARRALDLLPRGSPGWLRADDIAAIADR
jgi:predicted Zn-dependent protease